MMKFFVFLFSACFILSIESSCPNKCSGHGKCATNDQCQCDQYFTYGDCSGRLCPYSRAWVDSPADANDAHEYAECSNRGTCDRKTGQCICDDGYTGSACRRTSCPNGCSGNGRCMFIEDYTVSGTYNGWDREKITGCKCDPGFEGHDCKLVMCPKGDDPLTVGQYDMYQYIKFVGAPLATSQFYLSFEDVYGYTYTTDVINLDTSTAGTTCTNIQNALKALPTPIFQDVHVTSSASSNEITRDVVNYIPSDTSTTTAQIFTSTGDSTSDATLKQICLVHFVSGPGASGYQNLLVAHTAATVTGQTPVSTGINSAVTVTIGEHASVSLTGEIYPLTELTPCSGRGVCDKTKGQCTCFLGHKGIACESQDSLV